MMAVRAPHWARPSAESYGMPCTMSKRAHVGITQAERAVVVRPLSHRLAWELGHVHRDFKNQRPDAHGMAVAVDVEMLPGEVVELEQIERCEIAGGVVEEHVFRARDWTH